MTANLEGPQDGGVGGRRRSDQLLEGLLEALLKASVLGPQRLQVALQHAPLHLLIGLQLSLIVARPGQTQRPTDMAGRANSETKVTS